MQLPSEPVTLNVEQIAELNRKLATMRHDVNNLLSLIMASAELIQYKPHEREHRMATLVEQPARIAASIDRFSRELEQSLGITRP